MVSEGESMSTAHAIERDLVAAHERRAALDQEIEALQQRLESARAACRDRARQRSAAAAAVIARFEAGQTLTFSPIGSRSHWWLDDGQLLKRATREEVDAVDALVASEVLIAETFSRSVLSEAPA